MPEELKPCPFCGDDQPALAEEQDTGAWSITCIHCGIEIGNYAGERSVRSAWNRRTPVQPGPAAPTPDTFMGEPVLTRWKPLNRDDSRLALHQSMHNRSFGNPSDDKLMLEWLWENGYALCKRVPDEAAPTPQQQALDRMVENAETLGLYEAAPTEATLDQMANTAWDRFQRHTAELQALENCRLYAARHRKEEWSAVIRRFCADGGATGSPLREAAPTVVEQPSITETQNKWGRLYTAANAVVTRAGADGQISVHSPEIDSLMDKLHDLDDGQWMPGLMPPATPPRAALTEFQRMQIIGDEFPLALVDPLVIAKVDAVCRAIEAAHGIGTDRESLTVDEAIEALKSALRDSKGWLRDYSDAVIREAIDRTEPRAPLTDEQIDAGLDLILRAAGSALRHYTLPKSRDDMRAALRSVISTDREGG